MNKTVSVELHERRRRPLEPEIRQKMGLCRWESNERMKGDEEKLCVRLSEMLTTSSLSLCHPCHNYICLWLTKNSPSSHPPRVKPYKRGFIDQINDPQISLNHSSVWYSSQRPHNFGCVWRVCVLTVKKVTVFCGQSTCVRHCQVMVKRSHDWLTVSDVD